MLSTNLVKKKSFNQYNIVLCKSPFIHPLSKTKEIYTIYCMCPADRAVGRRKRAWDGRWRATAGETVTEALSSAGGSDGRRRRERCDLRGSDAHTPLSYLGQDRLEVWLF